MRKSPARQPELFVIADRVDDQSIALPLADRTAVVGGHEFRRRRLRTSIREDDAPIPVAAAQQDEDATQVPLLDELKSVGHEELPRASGGDAPRQRVPLEQGALAQLIESLCP